MRFGINTVPPQDVIAGPPDEDVSQQVWQLSFTVINQLEVLLQVWRIDRKISLVILMEQFDLAVNVPCTLVTRRRR